MSENCIDPQLQAAFDLAVMSTAAFGITYMEEHFYRPFSQIHRGFFNHLDYSSHKRKALAAPRGYGKTTILTTYVLRKSLHGLSKYIILVSNTLDKACEDLATIKLEIESNERIRMAFGDMKGRIWKEDRIELRNGTFILARGAGQQIRGLKHGNQRPDEFVVDDLEDSEGVMSEERRKKLKKWFYGDLMRAGKDSGKGAIITVIGTVLHEDALLTRLLESPLWASVRLEAFDDSWQSTDLEFLTHDDITRLRLEYEEAGELETLIMEYRNLVQTAETRSFKTFLEYRPGDSIHQMVLSGIEFDSMLRVVIGDPAKTTNMQSDYSAILGICIDLTVGSAFVHEVFHEKCSPEVFIDNLFDMADRLKTPHIFPEETGLNLWLKTVINSLMIRRKKIYNINPLKAVLKKEDRIAKVVPLVNRGMIHFLQPYCDPLINQLKSFPRSAHDDLMDCLAYLIPILKDSNGWLLDKPEDAPEEQEHPWETEMTVSVDRYGYVSKERFDPLKGNVI